MMTQSPATTSDAQAIESTTEDLRAMKRALAKAPLGPKAVLALSAAIMGLEHELDEAKARSIRRLADKAGARLLRPHLLA